MSEGELSVLAIGEAQEIAAAKRTRASEVDCHIGERLRFLRRLARISQRHVAQEIGVSFQQMQKYENGTNRVSAALLAEISGMFELPMDWFIGPYSPQSGAGKDSHDDYIFVLERLFCAFNHRNDVDCFTALSVIFQIVKVGLVPQKTRLVRLRRALRDGTGADGSFLREVVLRLCAAHAAPAAWPSEPDGTAAAVPGRVAAASSRVLLVDDDVDVLTMLAASLTGAGFLVSTAQSGDEALAILLRGTVVDVLVTDLAMEGMDGVDLLAAASQVAPTLPGLVMTGFTDAARLRDLPRGVEVLSKPFRRMELIGRLRLLIDREMTVR